MKNAKMNLGNVVSCIRGQWMKLNLSGQQVCSHCINQNKCDTSFGSQTSHFAAANVYFSFISCALLSPRFHILYGKGFGGIPAEQFCKVN